MPVEFHHTLAVHHRTTIFVSISSGTIYQPSKMFHKLILALPLLSLTFLALASPLEQREAAPGIIDDLLKGVLSQVAQLIKDVLSGSKSGIDDFKNNKPLICLPALDQCCVCKYFSSPTRQQH